PSAVKFKFEKLAQLHVWDTNILESSVESVAEFLRTISPGYLDIMASDVMDEGEDDYAPLWYAVMDQ
ncbi:hypothetical protein FRC00_011801, partial [Tulasnella sp. 408]